MIRATIRDQAYVELKFETGLPVGSEVAFSMFLDEELTPQVFTPINFTGKDFLCHVRKDLMSNDPDGEITVTPRGATPGDLGWLDFVLDGTQTGDMGAGDFHFSAKMFPTGEPENSRTFVVGVLPLRLFGTR